MRRLMLGLAMATLVMARPELYKEKEDFQYSRSSSDDGTKAGYYDAQRGNMGGNYERAHNMDPLAQHQFGGLVRQVEGELGDGSKTRTGSVFSAANSRGVYGSGHYDLSNLAGRNFQEGLSYRDSQSASSSLSNSAHTAQLSSQNNARYSTSGRNSNSNYRGYEANNLQGTQNLYNTNQYEQGMQAGHSSQYHVQSGYEGQNSYQERVNTDHLTAQNVDADTQHHRLISTVPVKIIVRPGQSIAVPIATQTHSGSQIDSYYDHNAANTNAEVLRTNVNQQALKTQTHSGSQIASYYDHNAANTDAEVLRTNVNQQAIKPSNSGKHYESSYSYRKEWEKHDVKPAVIPLSIPTLAPIPKNSELYDDSYLQRGTQYADNRYEQNTNFNSASSHSQHQTDLNAQHRSSASSNSHLNSFDQSRGNSKFDTQSDNLIGTLSSKPKSYQSSYSYHKAWERQGDPYVIKPATNGIYEAQTSDRLTDASNSQNAYSSYNYGTRKTQNQQYVDCEPGHTRVARSYNSNQDQLEQQSQNSEDLGQQTQNQWDNLADLGQQTQDQWTQTDNFGQQTLNKENLEDLGQQTQNQWENLADLGQQTQDQRTDNIGHQTLNKENLEDLGQQTQDKWDSLADHGQQTQDQWTQTDNFGKQTLNKENLEDLGQQTQNKWDNLAGNGQQTQEKFTQTDNFGQQTLNKENLEDLGQQTQNKWDHLTELGQQTEEQWTQTDNFGQQTLNKENLENFSQQTQDKWGQTESDGQQAQNKWNFENVGQQTQSKVDSNKDVQSSQSKLEQFGESQMDHAQQTQDIWGKQDTNEQSKHLRDFGQQSAQVSSEKTPSPWDKLSVIDQTQQSSYNPQESAQHTFQQHDVNQQSTGTWDVMHNQDQSFHGFTETQENSNAFHSDHEQNQHGNTGSLSNLWGKLDNLDNDNTQYSRNNENEYFTQTSNSQHFNQNWDQHETFHHSISNKDEKNIDFVAITHKQENITEKSPTVSDDRLTDNVKFTTPKADTEKNKIANNFPKNNGDFTTKTEKPQPTTNIIRPIDVGRGDIGPEESLIEVSKEPNNTDISNQKEQNIKNNETHKTYPNLDQEFVPVDKVSSNDSKFEISTSIVSLFSKENEEMTTEFESPRDMPQELETMNNNGYFEQNKGFEQENKQFIDSMKDFESQNSYQQATDDFSQQNKELDQQSNWNDESQNVEQQFVNDFSEQSQATATAHSFEQQFENFGQKHDTIALPSQQMNKDTNLKQITPQEVNEGRVIEEQVAMYKEPSLETFNKPNVANNPELDIPEENEPKVNSQNTETVTEKPGFWNSVGSKLSNVKSKVASWFGS